MTEETRNPSESGIAVQQEKAAKVFQDLEDEDGLIPCLALNAQGHGHGTRASAAPKRGSASSSGAAAPKAKATARNQQPLIYAAKQRAKTTKDFAECEKSLTRASELGERILTDIAPNVLGDDVVVAEDPSLQLLISRLELVKKAQDQGSGPASSDLGHELYEACMRDPYLKDLSQTLFYDPSVVQTVGALSHVRKVTMDL